MQSIERTAASKATIFSPLDYEAKILSSALLFFLDYYFLNVAFKLDYARNLFVTFFLSITEYCFMSQGLDLIVQTGPKVEEYFCCISELSAVILVLDLHITFFQSAAFFNLLLFF